MTLDPDALTSRALDLPSLLEALAARALTPRGRAVAAAAWPMRDPAAIRLALDDTGEALALHAAFGGLPVGGVDDVAPLIERAGKGGILDKAELRHAAFVLDALVRLGHWLGDRHVDAPGLHRFVPDLTLDRDLVAELASAFDETGELSGHRWPHLRDLRERVADLHVAIRRRLEELVKGDELGEALQDRFVTQRGDRYVIPIKANWKRKEMGIVHAVSNTGQTAFVEPAEVIQLNNELKVAQGELEAEERRILTELSRRLGAESTPIEAALAAATELDLASARAALARDLGATRPVVREDGLIELRAARHPLLVLRGVEVVPNDLRLDAEHPGLVISGPNTGGKTVALKTIGLAALLVRLGCWVPAAEGARVDVFPDVLAVVGDHQSVEGDQSSFSAHLAALGGMLARARAGCLFLVDEIASGTDPEQGAALAHAVVERLLDRGVRVVVTTHFQRLKTLGLRDPRVQIAGMQFAGGKPTWRMVLGASGESHALEAAVRLGLPADLVTRARALMDAGERGLVEALSALDVERTRAGEATLRADELARALEAERAQLAAREAELVKRAKALEQDRAASFVARLESAERAIGAIVADLQRTPSAEKVRVAQASLEALRALAPTVEDEPVRLAPLAVGDRVRVPHLRETGEVVGVGRQIAVRTARGVVLRVAPVQVEPDRPSATAPVRRPTPAPPEPAPGRPDRAVRTDGNTVDLRGLRVEEGLAAVEARLDRAAQAGEHVLFLLHGHGTGAMKQAIRHWLPSCRGVAAWAPATAEQGGDAFTVALVA